MAGRVIELHTYRRRKGLLQDWPGSERQSWNESLDRLSRHLKLTLTGMTTMNALDLAQYADDRRLELEREFDAPRELVWQMFADPYHLSHWWGPRGFTNPVVEIDLREGGRWHHVMRGPDGRDYPADSVFIEVMPPERIVYRNAQLDDPVFGDNPPPSFLRVITLDDLGGGRTRLSLVAYFETAANKDAVTRRGFRSGTEESWDKLAAHLATTRSQGVAE